MPLKLEERTSCPLCQSKQIQLFKKGTIDPQQVKTENFKITDSAYGSLWTLFSCKNCSFVFSNPYIPEKNITAFYSQLEDREYSTEAEGRSKNFKTILKRLKGITPPTLRLLDIGAASGIFLELARQQGYQIQGIEPSEFLVKEAEKHYNIQLFKGTVEEYKTNKTFSIITLLDIIEHLVEPDTFMTTVDSLIEKSGILVVVTPDINSLAARIMGKRWWHYRIAHINFFNLQSLQYLLEKHGYEIILKKKYVWNFSLFYLVTRIFPFLKHKKTLQKILKRLHLKLPLFDSWEIYARKRNGTRKRDI
ncbi:MAG: class I SAM-dependent methyltransferase [Candidatus Aminicenantes bacterium]|nr:MAG: class I SAM-dependent methyltransferase [Candidatus Aminicenantes bacterium]